MDEKKYNTPASSMALGGVLAALAVVIMCGGSLIPAFTYVSPMLCAILTQIVLKRCGRRTAWAWYAAVAILGILLAADKEAASMFLILGFYPILKVRFDSSRMPPLWKLLYFNISVTALYFVLLRVLGLSELTEEFSGYGTAMLVVLLLLGNVTFFLLDRLLGMKFRAKKGR